MALTRLPGEHAITVKKPVTLQEIARTRTNRQPTKEQTEAKEPRGAHPPIASARGTLSNQGDSKSTMPRSNEKRVHIGSSCLRSGCRKLSLKMGGPQ